MPINLTSETQVDTRGLPVGYDPHKLYEYRYLKRVKSATGLEGFIYQWIPGTLIKSLAIAFDPLSSFKLSVGVVTPPNRTRYRATASVLDIRHFTLRAVSTGQHPITNWMNLPGQYGPQQNDPVTVQRDQTAELNRQAVLPNASIDTTKRTRLFGSDVGEFDKVKTSIVSLPRQTTLTTYIAQEYTIFENSVWPNPVKNETITTETMRYYPTAATLSRSTFDNLIASERNVISALMQNHVLEMYKGANPQHRTTSFFRNLVELRDTPRSIHSLRDSIKHLAQLDASIKSIPKDVRKFVMNLKTSIKDIPNEYLSYHFGWKQTYKDVMDLLNAPQKVSKQLNLLLARSGQPTTYRSKRKFVSGSMDVPGFDYDTYFWHDFEKSVSSRIDRETELRMVINTTFRMPPLDVPTFRYQKMAEKLGVYPRITDIYNLTPWTWLVDWFTGFGNYVEVLDEINHDSSLINWGFLTAVTTGKLTTHFKSKTTSTRDYSLDFVASHSDINTTNDHTSILEFNLQLRKDLSTVLDVNKTSDPTTLSTYQQSILGALLSQKASFKRSRHTGG
ncbi:TPA_asm: maturation protein [ssRNA phage Zoerhiza.1_25]|uniref:Maturation protein n=2 Tax=Leviviricetes TaxID=2842243 RepID=A0A8S5L1H8_9VIRU|nr:maturation protein [ssRNA phage Zoerhiza.1_25]QDH89616.1 MAG: hypothetical protein H1Rhizo26FD342_000004 [Leviviridae sp.]DAD51497.1 TPA_asm: maturation protein [ssRNA phage Zoerhiza.1_25]